MGYVSFREGKAYRLSDLYMLGLELVSCSPLHLRSVCILRPSVSMSHEDDGR